MKSKMKSLSDIHPNAKNPRKISPGKLEKLGKSIKEFPEMMGLRPIIVNKEGVILGGNMRYAALIALGYKEVPEAWIMVADSLTPEEERRFIIEDNIEFGEWDTDLLTEGWSRGELDAWGMELINAESFQPNVNPETFNSDVTAEEIERRAQKLADQMRSNAASVKIECVCPECGAEFKIDAR